MAEIASVMAYASKIVLQLPIANPDAVAEFVEACLRDGVELISITGPDSDAAEDLIVDLVVGDGSDHTRFIMTSSHDDETLEEVFAFAAGWIGEGSGTGRVQLVRL